MRSLAKQRSAGHSAVEFALALPFVLLLLASVVEFSLVGIRGIVAEHAAFRASRVAAVYQKRLSDDELYAMLDPALFRGGVAAPAGDDMRIEASSRFLFELSSMWPSSVLRRFSPGNPALPDGLSNAILRGGDTPSPYCYQEGEYEVCGYPE